MNTRKISRIFIVFIMAVLACAAGFWYAGGEAFAEEKAEPEITYDVPADLDLTWESFNLNVQLLNCEGAEVSYYIPSSGYAEVDQDGNVTILRHDISFGVDLTISVGETETTKAKDFVIPVYVNWVPQEITCKSSLSTTMGKPVTIKASALGDLSYKSGNTSTATVSSAGKVTFKHPGKVTITVTADATGIYWSATKKVTVSCKMTAPRLTVTRPASRCAKLTWTKVGGAQQYMVYVKYPGKSKYKPVLSRPAKVKSVTHKNLKKGKYYSYKVRAYLISGGTVYYGPFSKVKTVKIR